MYKQRPTVLIIDDEEDIREGFELLLNAEGFATETAATGEEGIRAVGENFYDLVLLDLMLPGLSGMDVQRELKNIDPTLPVIIVTAMAAIETAVTAIKNGA